MKTNDNTLTVDMLGRYYELTKQKKEMEVEMNELKEKFHEYFDYHFGANDKGEVKIGGYKLQRQIRKTEKYLDEQTVKRLEELQMYDLIQEIKKPDSEKIKAAINLELLKEDDLAGCKTISASPAISVKPVTPR